MQIRNFEATKDFENSIDQVLFLKDEARQKAVAQEDEIRLMYLKLAAVNAVIKFQVFIESILKEYKYRVGQMSVKNQDLPCHLRLNWIKISLSDPRLQKCLSDPSTFNLAKLEEIRNLLFRKYAISHNDEIMTDQIEFNTKFPMGRQGLRELKKLFQQINGDDIFAQFASDEDKINEILNIRHKIVHEDANPTTLSEAKIEEYVLFLKGLVIEIDDYCCRYCD